MEKSQAELAKSTDFNKELIMLEAKYRSVAAEAEGEVKLLQRDSYALRGVLSTIRGMNQSLIEKARESKQERILAEQEKTRVNEDISSLRAELKKSLNAVKSLQNTL